MKKLIYRLARKHYNKVFKSIMSQAYNKLWVSSYEMHEIIGMWDRMFYPEYFKDAPQEVE